MEQDTHRGRGRPRSTQTDDRIASATMELIRERGPEAVNVASVAARSGVARTTIYRRHRDRTELLAAALRPVTGQGGPPQGASVRVKLAWLLERTREVLADGIGMGGVAAAMTGSDPEFGAALRAALDSALAPVREEIAADVAQGLLADHLDADLVLNLVLGSYLAEVVVHAAPRADWLNRTTDLLARSLAPDA